ncbi:MAG: hypothetical protein QXX83_03430 [Thermofilum sp.]
MRAEEIGLALIFTGFVVIFAAAAILAFSSLTGELSVGGCIAVAVPIPICFGAGSEAPLLVLIPYIVFLVFFIIALLILWPLRRSPADLPLKQREVDDGHYR